MRSWIVDFRVFVASKSRFFLIIIDFGVFFDYRLFAFSLMIDFRDRIFGRRIFDREIRGAAGP